MALGGFVSRRERVVILGGGMAGLTTAWSLTSTAALRERYEVTLFQKGWRLGGQTASGRGEHGRIEEHGLHVLLGCYENTFALMRSAYDELGRAPGSPLARWRDAFEPLDAVVMHERVDGELRPWTLRFPRNDRTPGDGGILLGAGDALTMASRALRGEFAVLAGELARHGAWSDVAAVFARGVDPGAVQGLVRSLSDRAARGGGDAVRRAAVLLDLLATTVVGMLRDRVATRGFDELDELDLRAWLRRHGGGERMLGSALMRTAYDLVFASDHDETPRSGLAAGVGLRFFLRAFAGYKGSIGWPMRAGTGDVLVAPLYQVLRRRGVRFEFFHDVRRVELDASARAVERVHFGRQARFREGAGPLVDVRGLPSWPSEPAWGDLEDGESLRGARFESSWERRPAMESYALERGTDFDTVVLALGLGALPAVTAEMTAASERWRAMLDHVATTPTVAYQAWTCEARGATHAPMGNSGTAGLGGFGDMSRVLGAEAWPAVGEPRHVLHACERLDSVEPTPLHEDGFDAREQLRAMAIARGWVERGGGVVVPGGLRGGVVSEYGRVNVEPTDRYVLSVPGSTRYRLGAAESGFGGLILAGSWTRNGWNLGAVESAVMSGLQAARTIAGVPVAVPGERDFG